MKDWLSILEKYNCAGYIKNTKQLNKLLKKSSNPHFCSGCSKTKTLKNEIPKLFYRSTRLLGFYSYCETNDLNYGILSDKYGIHMMDEVREYYDIHPSSLTDEEFKRLGEMITAKAKALKIDCFIYYNPSPLMGTPYFKMLNHSGIPYYYISKRISLMKLKTLGL